MEKGQYQLLIGLIVLTSVAASIGLIYYFSFMPKIEINQNTTTTTHAATPTTTSSTIISTTQTPVTTSLTTTITVVSSASSTTLSTSPISTSTTATSSMTTTSTTFPTTSTTTTTTAATTIPYAGNKFVGIYYEAPGSINNSCTTGCGYKGCGWPDHLAHHPLLGKYEDGTNNYINFALNDIAAQGIDFIVVDESNGIHYGCPSLQLGILNLLDIADSRIRAGIATPHITIMSPYPGAAGGCKTPGCPFNDNDWIYDNLVYKNGVPRPSWMWLDGKPVWGVYSASPFNTSFTDSRFFIRYICNSQNNECHQAQVDLGTVWPWATMGADSTRCTNCPLYSSNSSEITIQDGYQNLIPCYDYWNIAGSQCFSMGFTSTYFTDQWDYAISKNPQIIVITGFNGVEGGWTQNRTDFSPTTLFEDMSKQYVQSWKGSLGLANLGP